ncbi:MAG: hypothetical protein ACC628_15130 [Pirellulaceae bacterium]
MFRKMTIATLALFPILLIQPMPARAADSATSWVPPEAVLVVEVTKPGVLLDRAFREDLVELVTSHPLYKQQINSPQAKQAQNLIKFFEKKYDTDWQTLLKKLVGGGITWAVGPGEASLLIVESEDAKLLEEIHEFFLMIAHNDGDPEELEYPGMTAYRFGPNEAHAIVGNRLILSNQPEVLKKVAELKGSSNAACIATSKRYQEAKLALGNECFATVFANMNVLKQLPQVQKVLKGRENPFAHLIFAPLLGALQESTWLGIGVGLDGDTAELEITMDGEAADPSAPDGFACPAESGDGAFPNLDVNGKIAEFSFYRDLHKFYSAKDELFPERTSGIIFFENMMGIFFTGRDLTEEVFAETSPDVRFVVATQEYEDGTPRTQIPSFAVVLRMKNPEKFSVIAEEAWQKALGLVNFTRGQQAQAGLIIDRPTHGDVKYTMASFSAAGEADKEDLDIRFNFQPSLAMPGEYLILCSSDSLTRALIDALQKEAADQVEPLAGANTLIEIDGKQLATILNANREALIRQNMVEEGNSREEAESAIGMLLMIAEHIGQVALKAGANNGRTEIGLTVDFNLP